MFRKLRQHPTPTAPSPKPPRDPVEAQEAAATAFLTKTWGSVESAPGDVRIPERPRTMTLERARFLAQCRGDVDAMRAMGVPEATVQSHIPHPPVTPPPAPPAAPAPPPELPARFVQPGVRPVLGQIVHAFTPYPGACTNMSVAETYTGFRNLGVTSSDSPDPVVRLENAAAGPDRISAKTVYRYDPAPVPQGEATPVTPTPPTWHRAGPGCPFGR
jgi:hypothetical protein